LLAPFMDKMTDREVSKRFTAEEALTFLSDVISQLSADTWNASLSLETDFGWTVIPAAYWSWTPPGFADAWSGYQTRPWSWTELVIDRICSYPIGWRAVCYMRSMLRR
ncbi:uncharacterized protein TRAVEDRAFT_114103, partial [Trametes versicolor FP-101664 SS1]|uniref:uncharacterized protein n=1 Tax=Trametes versicolor (strain FP-101664) TaxID=717944 RepID=UPI000462147A